MPFNSDIIKEIEAYMEHIPSREWISQLFDFIKDSELKDRIIQEYFNARYVYKFFEGMEAKGEMLKSESRLQVIMYANVYEAVIHYVLFSLYKDNPLVNKLLYSNELKKWSIKSEMQQTLEKCIIRTSDDEKITIIPCRYSPTKKTDSDVKFKDKAECPKQLGLINNDMQNWITDIYSFRNGIHLHAELRKKIDWDLEKAKDAYWHVEGFIKQIKTQLQKDGLYTLP